MIKNEEEHIKRKNKPKVSERRMDELAWLLEGSSMCSAVSVINGKFYVSANDFFDGTESRENNQKLRDVCNIMEYFRDIANKTILLKDRKEKRDKLMVTICENQISAASLGRITIPVNILNKIVSTDVLQQKKLPNLIDNPEGKQFFEKHAGDAYRALSYGLDIYKRFLKIEQGIDKANAKDFSKIKITQEQLIAFKNFTHDDSYRNNSNILFLQKDGGGISKVNETKPKLVHAEAQILNQIVKMCEEGTIPPPNEIYIGISKRCCLNCHCLLDAANEELKKINILIKYEGVHDASFNSNWGNPPFFRQAEAGVFGKTRKKTKEITKILDEEKPLGERIRKKYLEKIKSAEEADSYNMGYSPSSSEYSLDSAIKFENYKQLMIRDLETFKRRGFNDNLAEKMFDVGVTLCNTTEFYELFDIDYLDASNKKKVINLLEEKTSIDKESLIQFLTNETYSSKGIAESFISFFQFQIGRKATDQLDSDYSLAWRLQVEEYKKQFKEFGLPYSFFGILDKNIDVIYEFKEPSSDTGVQFILQPTSSGKNGRDCFFGAVNESRLTRESLVNQLIANSHDISVRKAFNTEIRQFLYLGFTGIHIDNYENEACLKLLGDSDSAIRRLFSSTQATEEELSKAVNLARERLAGSNLNKSNTAGKNPRELLDLLKNNNNNIEVINKLEAAYLNMLNLNENIIGYCLQENVFKDYVNFYLKQAQGYIPFSRDFSGGNNYETTVDVINSLFGLNIQVYLRQGSNSNQLIRVNKSNDGGGEPILIIHNGINHFDRLNHFNPFEAKEKPLINDEMVIDDDESNLEDLSQEQNVEVDTTHNIKITSGKMILPQFKLGQSRLTFDEDELDQGENQLLNKKTKPECDKDQSNEDPETIKKRKFEK